MSTNYLCQNKRKLNDIINVNIENLHVLTDNQNIKQY